MPGLTMSLPAEPDTQGEWQRAADAADALLNLDAALTYGVVPVG